MYNYIKRINKVILTLTYVNLGEYSVVLNE